MTKKIETVTISSLKDFAEFIEKTLADAKTPLWYRGVNTADRELIPRLYKHPKNLSVSEVIALETRMMQTFKERCVPYLVRNLTSNWEYLFLMQHFGVPTRLLDWTENPFIGLYFAIAHLKPETAGDAVIWVLNPKNWNKTVLEKKDEGEVLSKENALLDGYAPEVSPDLVRENPIAMYGIHNSSRIVSQKGVFTIFGKSSKSMDSLYTTLNFPEKTLIKIVLPQKNLKDLSESLISIGFSESMLFPDLEGLAREIRRACGFEALHV